MQPAQSVFDSAVASWAKAAIDAVHVALGTKDELPEIWMVCNLALKLIGAVNKVAAFSVRTEPLRVIGTA